MNKPLIFDFCTSRRSDFEKPIYRYDTNKNLNVINVYGENIPFVNFEDNRAILEMETITKVQSEGTDENSRMLQSFFETETTTRVMREGNDINMDFLELLTKTDVNRERDDE